VTSVTDQAGRLRFGITVEATSMTIQPADRIEHDRRESRAAVSVPYQQAELKPDAFGRISHDSPLV
jgi:hypothetical protein